MGIESLQFAFRLSGYDAFHLRQSPYSRLVSVSAHMTYICTAVADRNDNEYIGVTINKGPSTFTIIPAYLDLKKCIG